MKKATIVKYTKMLLPALIVGAFLWFFFIREKNNTVYVRKVALVNRVVVRTVTASGSVVSNSEADLSFQSIGEITKVTVKEGDVVKKGQLLAALDNTSLSHTIQSYRDALDIKIREKELFVANMYENRKTLGGDKEYQIKLREYGEGVSQANAAYEAQVALLDNLSIYAPFNGIATNVYKGVGETAALGETAIKVADLNDTLFRINVDQEDFGLLKESMDVEVKFDSFKGDVFKGKVSKLPYYANTDTNQFDIDIKVNSSPGKPLVLGMKGDAYIILQTSVKEVPSLTVDEVSYDESDNPYIWVLDNGKIKKLPVDFGVEGDVYVEIKNTIDKTILVSSKDTQKMIEGYKAKIIN
jgi:RND family efflux transporter MFP subunit